MDIDKDKKVFAQANGWIMNFSSSNSSDMAKKKIKSCAFCKNFTCCSPYGYGLCLHLGMRQVSFDEVCKDFKR